MTITGEQLSGKESLHLIASMINKARYRYGDTGVGTILWGSVIAVCSLVKLSEIQFNYRWPFDIFWLMFVAVIPQIFITIREKRRRKVKSYDDAYMHYIWMGFGTCILPISFIVNSVFTERGPVSREYRVLTGHALLFRFNEFASPLLLYGGLICRVCCGAIIYTNIRIDLLLTVISAVCAWLIPGIVMKKEHREAKMQEASLHV